MARTRTRLRVCLNLDCWQSDAAMPSTRNAVFCQKARHIWTLPYHARTRLFLCLLEHAICRVHSRYGLMAVGHYPGLCHHSVDGYLRHTGVCSWSDVPYDRRHCMLHLPPGPNPQRSDGLLCLPGLLITTAPSANHLGLWFYFMKVTTN